MRFKKLYFPATWGRGGEGEGGAEESAAGQRAPRDVGSARKVGHGENDASLRAPGPRREEAGYGSGGARAAGYAAEAGYAELKRARVR